jgi:Tfp pilus assembly protein PilF
VTSGTTAASPEESVRTVSALEKAAALAPGVIVFQYELAHALHGLRHDDEAAALLERALASAAQQDAEYVVRARALLAELYAARGQRELAAAQYRLILAESPRPAFLRAARVFFDPPQR